ncbi:hypothetical protein RRG08_063509 [Elysia crispata]|uniref:Uncharacterized protein n=1 Tax=Elysia crispata TaxID=231223 RepID=A0AAE1B2I9_9GAST|nr:hypothetical protein RRG08_063509 [Elysia crispata]
MGLEELSHECTTLTCGSLRMGLCKLLVKNRQNENKSGVEQVSPLAYKAATLQFSENASFQLSGVRNLMYLRFPLVVNAAPTGVDWLSFSCSAIIDTIGRLSASFVSGSSDLWQRGMRHL